MSEEEAVWPGHPTLSAIIPVRNRGGARLENCVRSLRWQRLPEGVTLEIVISDYGSDDAHRADVEAIAARHDARVVFTPERGVWNRSRALNIGIQASRAFWTFCTDVDMIFAPNFVASLLEAHQDTSRDAMIHCRCHDLPESVPLEPWQAEDFPKLLAEAEVRRTKGTGACQSARRSFFHRVRGYDERYTFWGAEDVDMTARAQRAGLDIVWVSDRTQMLHQWHPKELSRRPWNFRLNRWRYRLTKWQIAKNPGGWGGVGR